MPGEGMKPLFIPLKRQYFEAFADRSKTEELRRYGPRWNHHTCQVGRPVVLSLGYGKTHRINGTISYFQKQHGTGFGNGFSRDILAVFGTLDLDIARISIILEKPRSLLRAKNST